MITWGHDALRLEIRDDRLVYLGPPGGEPYRAALPLVEVTATGHGRHWSTHRLVDTTIGARMRYRRHHATADALTVELHDPQTGLAAEVIYRSPEGLPVLRSEVILRNEGEETVLLESVTSLTVGGLTAAVDSADVLWADNDWLAEYRWQRRPLRVTSPQLSGRVRYGNGKCRFALAGQGVWSSCGNLPMGGLADRETGRTWLWQIEHNGGGWHWECGEREGAAYVALSGPSDAHHGWRHPLAPGEVFRSVPVALAVGDHDGAFAALTRYRRAIRRPHPDHQRLPVIFNDYMNCLMGDPTTEKLLPLIDAAAEAGAEYFVIDAGWYADADEDWWGSVGAWEPSASRFPGERGIHEVLDRIRARGMTPGLWLEPEVIGVRSPLAQSLPDEAFFRRDGVRVTENFRHHLDLRHPAARGHLDRVVDRLVGEYGIGYLKLDHNIDPGSGTASAPTAVPPEQGAVWAYPQPGDSPDEVAFTMAGALLGRIHLSGLITELGPEARDLVHEAVTVYKDLRADLPQAVPAWPLGLPAWDDPWIALALHAPAATYLTLWRRGGEETIRLPYPNRAELLYPAGGKAAIRAGRQLTVTLPTAPSAALLRLR